MPDELVKVLLSNVRVAVAVGPGVEAGTMTLREEAPPHRSLSIVIGQPEARAILSAWTGTAPSRPSTWDLFVAALAVLEGRLDRAVITAVEEQRHFFAAIELEHDCERRVVAARPSDAVALALRAYGAEIFVAEGVMAEAGVSPVSDHSN
jgi:bifunctional DNase/RNase